MFEVSVSLNKFIDNLISDTDSESGYIIFDRVSICKLINEIRSNQLGIAQGSNSYWTGILFLEPWYDLEEERDLSERDLIDILLQYNIVIKDSNLVFSNVANGDFYDFFIKHSDGYGGNIPHNIQSIMHLVLYRAKKIILEDLKFGRDTYGDYFSYLD